MSTLINGACLHARLGHKDRALDLLERALPRHWANKDWIEHVAVNRPGYGHVAFVVDDVPSAREAVLAAGGSPVGNVVTLATAAGSRVTWVYVTDPEGNVIELQSWSKQA